MKKQAILLLAFVAVLFAACQNNAPSEATSTTEATVDSTAQQAAAAPTSGVAHAVNTQNSVIEWIGFKPTGSQHNGNIKLQGGEILVDNGNITGGKFTIDMNSLAVLDQEGGKKAKLESHLKDSDFFEVATHPTGAFEITSVEPLTGDASGATHKVNGTLTLKGVAKPISIPAKVAVTEGKISAETTEFTINRTEWGVQYKSGVIGTVKDELIADDVKLKIKLEAGI